MFGHIHFTPQDLSHIKINNKLDEDWTIEDIKNYADDYTNKKITWEFNYVGEEWLGWVECEYDDDDSDDDYTDREIFAVAYEFGSF